MINNLKPSLSRSFYSIKKLILLLFIITLHKCLDDFDINDDYKIGIFPKTHKSQKNHIHKKTSKTENSDTFKSMFNHMKSKNIENSFKKRINAIKIENWENKETIAAINELEKIFVKNYKNYKPSITSKKSTMSLNDNLSAFAKAHKYDKSLGAHTYGVKIGENFTKVLISGAQGKKKKATKKTQNPKYPL